MNNISSNNRIKPLNVIAAIPKSIKSGQNLYKKFSSNGKFSTVDVCIAITNNLIDTKSFEIDSLWGKLERVFNDGKEISNDFDNSMESLGASLGIFYYAVNDVYENLDINSFNYLMESYSSARSYVTNKLIADNSDNSNDKSVTKTLSTLDKQFNNAIKQFNKAIDENKIQGEKISVSF